MLLTICTIHQLPQALALGNSFSQFEENGKVRTVLIGLIDDPAQLPSGFVSPYSILPIQDLLSTDQLATLSAKYTPVEFAAACKPLFIADAFRRYPDTDQLIYADPSILFLSSTAPIWEQLNKATVLITPHISNNPTLKPTSKAWPDEKHFQNVGLYSSDFLAFRRSAETSRMLAWWDNRVRERAYINFCEGLCLDQIWLMHVPVFFRDVVIVKNPGWHVALWNLTERTLHSQDGKWLVNGPSDMGQPLQFMNFKGLLNPDEGLFVYQNRVRTSERSDVIALLQVYRDAIATYSGSGFDNTSPAYGSQPQPKIIRGWRQDTIKSMKAITRFINGVYLPAIR